MKKIVLTIFCCSLFFGLIGIFGNTSVSFASEPCAVGDLDCDNDVDRDDLKVILSYRNEPASHCPLCDIDGNDVINVIDARRAVLLCTRPRCTLPLTGDVDDDNDVDIDDINIIVSFRNQPASDCPSCDIDGDGVITVSDARRAVLLCTSCPKPLPGDLDADGDVDDDDKLVFRQSLGQCEGNGNFNSDTDYDNDGCTSHADYKIWVKHFRVFTALAEADYDNDGDIDRNDYILFRKSLGKRKGDTGFNPRTDYDGDDYTTYRDYRIWYGHYKSYRFSLRN